jgi:hypothetical protein
MLDEALIAAFKMRAIGALESPDYVGFIVCDAQGLSFLLRDWPIPQKPDDFWSKDSWMMLEPTLTRYATTTSGERKRHIVERLDRDSRFRESVLAAFGRTCFLCPVGLTIVQAAHIDPVASQTSTDDLENGLAMCPTHHALFDLNVIEINEGFEIKWHDDLLERVMQGHAVSGLDLVKDTTAQILALPGRSDVSKIRQYIRQRKAYMRGLAADTN